MGGRSDPGCDAFSAERRVSRAWTSLTASRLRPAPQIRPLSRSDYSRGHLELLSILTQTPDIGETAWQARFDLLRSYPDSYFPVVIVRKETDRIVACGTVILERKFIRGAGIVGHIEDIATAKDAQGKGLGKRIIEALTGVAFARGACAWA